MNLKDMAGGAVVGVLAAALIGKTPPLTFLPEEIVTYPAAALIGGLTGFRRIRRVLSL
jgi:hypothetical protein